MPTSSDATIQLFKIHPKREATGEVGGLLTGTDPTAFTTSDPLRLWIIQVAVIIMMAQLLSLGLRRMKQPKVIAEVLGGILLGPTAFGRIPGFTDHIFPAVSLPYLSLVANIGLCLFLFLVGLEIRRKHYQTQCTYVGIALPFGLGTALSVPLYHHFIDSSVHFTYFMLFTGVAYSITRLPKLKLLDTNVGIIVLSAGVGNDVVGWTLLALSVRSPLWILLICVAFTVFLLWPVKWVMLWLARKTGSTENGPTMFYMTTVMILLWACAFFTDSVGVNAIFGAFLAGIIVPREGGLAITLTEKLEDMVSIVFLPLYFTLSGLNTDLGLLDNGITWAFTIAIICLSFSGKFGGCTIAAKLSGSSWREASTIGSLMSCKGLVELIVLNVGLEAGILSQRVFSMFVLEALTLTFLTTPLVTALYPPERRVRVGNLGATGTPAISEENGDFDKDSTILDHIPGVMAVTQLILPPPSNPSSVTSTTTVADSTIERINRLDVSVDALRLIELSDRTSAVMKSSVADTLIHTDPLLGIYHMFGKLNDLPVSTSLSVVPYDDLAYSVADHAKRHASQLVLLPWLPPAAHSNTVDSEVGVGTPKLGKGDYNPFEAFFGGVSRTDNSASATHSHFVRGVFAESPTDVALYIDTGDRSGAGGYPHIFFPFFGGPDDRLALEFVVQLCLNPRMTATVVRMVKRDAEVDPVERPSTAHVDGNAGVAALSNFEHTANSTNGPPDTIYGQLTTQTRLQSETADNITWSKYAYATFDNGGSSSPLCSALSRIQFSDLRASGLHEDAQTPAHRCRPLETARQRETTDAELKQLLEEHRSVGQEVVRKTVGDVATAMVVAGSASAMVVLQAAGVSLE
ncbi:Sodium/hydrogen exchanger family-domain-containing protein [Melanogaster broomeanus]|nr:Sodium/hydrogen exchanger family-domain-containing protein [Melanogaster broomeanus]